MKPRLLVVTSVHPADDPRIREKLIRSLQGAFEVTYATEAPGPTSTDGLTWTELHGSRSKRRTMAGTVLRSGDYDIAVIHDPELVPAAMGAAKRGNTVVFDVHEDVPAQILTKEGIPLPLRRPLAAIVRRYLRRAEANLNITLAEPGYASLFTDPHPVFANYPNLDRLPVARRTPDGPIVYVGDVTEIRGALTLVEAAGRMESERHVVFVGRHSNGIGERLVERAVALDVVIELVGWKPHPEAMEIAASAAVGVSPLHDVPNYRNSLPTKTLEYMALGTPTVASDLRGTREVIGDLGGVVLTPPGDASALASALDHALANDQLTDEAFAGAEDIRKRFRWPADDVRAYYLSLLD